MNTTKHDSVVVVFIAWRIRSSVSRRRISAITIAPTAPIAPPSVGVATPLKIVPSTTKISASGGINTKDTRSASAANHRSLTNLLEKSITNAHRKRVVQGKSVSIHIGIREPRGHKKNKIHTK